MAKKNPDYKYGDKFKFKDVKIYCSTEWMANSTKKYRKVFDKSEINYLRFEISFYNKLFDEEAWDAKVSTKVYNITGGERTEIFVQDSNINIKLDDNIVYVYESWGVADAGGFWKKADYICEAYIDDKFIGSQKFFVENVGRVSAAENPYFDIVSLKLYSGKSDGWKIEERTYLKQFHQSNTQYIWTEMKIRNKTDLDWNFEYFINFYNAADQHKAQIDTLRYIEAGNKDKIYTFDRGWGSDEGGSWKNDHYDSEILFMDTLVAAVKFVVGEDDEEGELEMIKGSHISAIQQQLKEADDSNESMETIIKRLDELIGLQDIKNKIRDHIKYLDFLRLRKEKGFDDDEVITLHSVFTGNPGTGKTTVVKLLGKLYQKMGLLSKGHVHEVDRADLVGEYIGQTAPKVKEAIKEARGGILFVDEAYSLARANDDAKDFGKEVIEVLLKEMSDGVGDLAIMVAGYPKEMDFFLNSNPGMKSRFKYYFHFEDYFPDELSAISEYACTKRSVKLAAPAKDLVNKILLDGFRNRDKSFGNARYAYSIIDESKMNLGLRLMQLPDVKSLSNEILSTIELEDVEKIITSKRKKMADIAIDENLLRESLRELNALVGLNNIKNDVNELVKLVRYYRESGKDVLNKFSLHTVFTGNPGTGKTTVARIMGKIYKSLGLLERGHVVETARDGLVAGYIGQTALKTKAKVDEAIGGVLFVDEAYALSDGGQTSYGKEAIEVILKNMEDSRGRFAVIVAGYPDNMDNFLKSNPGLKSRFDRIMHFIDYTPEQLFDISSYLLSLESLKPDTGAEEHLKAFFNELHLKRDKYFGNARTIRQTIEKAIKNQNLRMASLESEKRTLQVIETLTLDDVKEFVVEDGKRGSAIGFRNR